MSSQQTRIHLPSLYSDSFFISLFLSFIFIAYALSTNLIEPIAEVSIGFFAVSYVGLESARWGLWKFKNRRNTFQLWADNTLSMLEASIIAATSGTIWTKLLSKSAKIYLVVGNRRSGKSTLIRNTDSVTQDNGFQYQNKGIVFHQWWFNPNYICLETSALTSADNDAGSFKKYMLNLHTNLSWKYQSNGYSGIIVNLSCESILNDKNQHLNQKTSHLQSQLECISSFAPNIPVFVVITFFDIIPNFKAFFHDFAHEDFEKPFGFTLSKNQALKTSLKEQIQKITEAIEEHLIHILEKYPHHLHAELHEKVHAFQYTIYNLQPKVLDCIEQINHACPNPLQGVLYTCQHTEKQNITDHKVSNIPSIFDLSIPKAFFSKNVLHAINRRTKRLPSKRSQLALYIAILTYLFTFIIYPKQDIISNIQQDMYTQLTQAPSTFDFYKNKIPKIKLFPFVLSTEKKTPSLHTDELSVLNNPSDVYPTVLKQTVWPILDKILITHIDQLLDPNSNEKIASIIFYGMITGKFPKNIHFMSKWLQETQTNHPLLLSSDAVRQLEDILQQNNAMVSHSTWDALSPYPVNDDIDQLLRIHEILTPYLVGEYTSDQDSIELACSIKATKSHIFGPWTSFDNISDCKKHITTKITKQKVAHNLQSLEAMTNWDTFDSDLGQYRKNLIELDENLAIHLNKIQLLAKEIRSFIHDSDQLAEQDKTLITETENIQLNDTQITIRNMIHALSSVTQSNATSTTAIKWIQDIARDSEQAKNLTPQTQTNIFLRKQLNAFWKAIIAKATLELNNTWQKTLTDPLSKQVANHFPFVKDISAKEVSAETFNKLFAPSSLLSTFINKHLSCFIEDAPEGGLQWKNIAGYKLPFSEQILHMIMSHSIIQKMYFPHKGADPQFNATLQFQNGSENIRNVSLIQGSQTQSFSRDRPVAFSINWPNTAETIMLQVELDNGDIIILHAEQGFWNIPKYLKSHVKKHISDQQKLLMFKQGNTTLEFMLYTENNLNILTEDITENFRLPHKIY